MTQRRLRFRTNQDRIEDLVWLVNEAPHVVPERMGAVSEVRPALVYSEQDEGPHKVFVGKPEYFTQPFPHNFVDVDEAPDMLRRISSATLQTESGLHLAVDGDSIKDEERLAVVQSDLGDQFGDVFIGGFSEYESSQVNPAMLCTAGLVRQAARFVGYREDFGLDREQMLVGFGMSISQFAIGFPMPLDEIIDEVKSGV